MPKAVREHHSDEFGKTSSGSSTYGLNPPAIGYGPAITLDGIVEKESGVTPPPPPVSVKVLAIGFVVMFLAGLIGLYLLSQYSPVALHGAVERAVPADSSSR